MQWFRIVPICIDLVLISTYAQWVLKHIMPFCSEDMALVLSDCMILAINSRYNKAELFLIHVQYLKPFESPSKKKIPLPYKRFFETVNE
jgi:hypothetical protein